jgi:thymidylate kinase
MTNLSQRSNFVGLVGPCSAGKSTLIDKLQVEGYQCRHIAQEHSYVPDMWQKIVNPLVLVYLDVSYGVSMDRKKLNMSIQEFDEQNKRLDHARQNADIYLFTDSLNPGEVLEKVLEKLQDQGIRPHE